MYFAQGLLVDGDSTVSRSMFGARVTVESTMLMCRFVRLRRCSWVFRTGLQVRSDNPNYIFSLAKDRITSFTTFSTSNIDLSSPNNNAHENPNIWK